MTATKRTYTADFFCLEQHDIIKTTVLTDLLKAHVGRHAPALSINGERDVKYQIRSIGVNKTGTIYRAVFGKLRHDGTPEQASEDGDDSDVELKPGHGLVEKSHFLFFPTLNLLVVQRNSHAGRESHFQNYLNTPTYKELALVPILTRDSYTRLLEGGKVKRLEISLKRPAFALAEEDALLKDCVDMFANSNAGRMKLVFSANVGETLKDGVKEAALKLAKFGRTRVARATLAADNEVIDLILDRVIKTFEVDLQPNGRPDPADIFVGLAKAKDDCAAELKAYFHT